MVANTAPIFTLTPKIGMGGNLTTGTNTYTGTSGTTVLFTAGSNGSYVQKLALEAQGTNVASVIRIFINNGSTSGTAANNTLVQQYSLPATTASATAATQHIEIPLNIQLPNAYTLIGVLGTTVSAGWTPTVIGGDY